MHAYVQNVAYKSNIEHLCLNILELFNLHEFIFPKITCEQQYSFMNAKDYIGLKGKNYAFQQNPTYVILVLYRASNHYYQIILHCKGLFTYTYIVGDPVYYE